MDRWEIDLEIVREKEPLYIRSWRYLKVGYCDGACKMSFDRTGKQDPNEIDSLVNIEMYNFMYLYNESQPGCSLVLYYEEKDGDPWTVAARDQAGRR